MQKLYACKIGEELDFSPLASSRHAFVDQSLIGIFQEFLGKLSSFEAKCQTDSRDVIVYNCLLRIYPIKLSALIHMKSSSNIQILKSKDYPILRLYTFADVNFVSLILMIFLESKYIMKCFNILIFRHINFPIYFWITISMLLSILIFLCSFYMLINILFL